MSSRARKSSANRKAGYKTRSAVHFNFDSHSTSSRTSSTTASSTSGSLNTVDRIDTEIESLQKQLFEAVCDIEPFSARGIKSRIKLKVVLDRRRSERGMKNLASTVPQQVRMMNNCQTAINDAENELDAVKRCMELIVRIKALKAKRRIVQRLDELNNKSNKAVTTVRRGALLSHLQQIANSLPLWIAKPSQEAPALCGSKPMEEGYICIAGELVAARIKSTKDLRLDDGNDANWILAEVISYSDGKYQVIDVDPEQSTQYILPRKKVIPLPKWKANAATNLNCLFESGSGILALYPQTTCFYRGIVENPPSNPSENYSIKFEDASYPGGYSPALLVPQKFLCQEDN